MKRVQVQGLGEAPKRYVAPVQGDTFVAPPVIPKDTRFADLANALSSFSGVLSGVAAKNKQDRDLADKKNAMREQHRINGLTAEEYKTEIQSGNRPIYDSDHTQIAADKAMGIKYGNDTAAEFKKYLATDFDWSDPEADVEAAIHDYFDKAIEGREGQVGFLTGTDQGRLGLIRWAAGEQERRRVQAHGEKQIQAVTDTMDIIINTNQAPVSDDFQGPVRPPEAVAKSIVDVYQEQRGAGLTQVSPKQFNQTMLNKANLVAAEHPEVAIAMLTAPIPGDDGQVRSLADNSDPTVQRSVVTTVEKAYKTQDTRLANEFTADLVNKDVAAIMTGNAAGKLTEEEFIGPNTGAVTTITEKERQKQATTAYFEASQEIAKRRGETVASQTLERELRDLRGAGLEHPRLKESVSNLADLSAVNMSNPDEVIRRLEVYQWLRNESTHTLQAYTTQADRDFADLYLFARNGLNQTRDIALQSAVRVNDLYKSGNLRLSREDSEDLSRLSDNMATKPGFFFGTNDTRPRNFSTVSDKILRGAKFYKGLGLSNDEAIRLSAKSIKENSLTYNGMVFDSTGFDLPDNFSATLDNHIDKWMEQNPRLVEMHGYSREDITIQPAISRDDHGGKFVLADKETLLPLADEYNRMATVTLKGLREDAAKSKVQRQKDKIRTGLMKAKAKIEGLSFVSNGQYADKEGFLYKAEPTKGGSVRFKKTGKRVNEDKNERLLKSYPKLDTAPDNIGGFELPDVFNPNDFQPNLFD